MCQISIKMAGAVLYNTHMRAENAAKFARRALVVSYYTQNKVSIGYCAPIVGMN